MDKVFKALADETRRYLLDRLREENGQTLGELCARLGMTRQSVTQHLAVLEAANLVGTTRRGREKLHYLNPAPLHEVRERWIDKFERPLGDVERRAEEPVEPEFGYVTYIGSTPERVWQALTDADLTARYRGHRDSPDRQVGSGRAHRRASGSDVDDVVGRVVEADPPRRLVTAWADPAEPAVTSTVTFRIDAHGGTVRLTVTHSGLADEAERARAASGWAAVLSNLKSLLETGHVLPGIAWETPAHPG
ncbi:ArsR/SmtB family transcription factor [Actinosynnema sp. CA-299493]